MSVSSGFGVGVDVSIRSLGESSSWAMGPWDIFQLETETAVSFRFQEEWAEGRKAGRIGMPMTTL